MKQKEKPLSVSVTKSQPKRSKDLDYGMNPLLRIEKWEKSTSGMSASQRFKNISFLVFSRLP
jgi:hypothetical protein